MTSPMVQALNAFGAAIAEAERHRKFLRQNCGLTDHQIGMWTLAHKPKRTMSDFKAATLAAKLKMAERHDQQSKT